MRSGRFNVVIGAQAGSESKGKLALYLAQKYKPKGISMAASPNAGHTAYKDGRKYVTYHLPVSCIADHGPSVFLGPSSVFLPDKFLQEMKDNDIDAGRVNIHPRSVVIKASHIRKEKEEGLLKIGSTNQGVGEARIEKIRRSPDVVFMGSVNQFEPMIGDTTRAIHNLLRAGDTVLHEMTQGFDLCLEHGIDSRYCTSKMIHPAMAMAEAGVSPLLCGDIIGVLRPYPIRVNNRDGSSGPYAESPEITWDLVRNRCGAPTPLIEMTTTTKLPRRVFEFCWSRMDAFVRTCGPTQLCLQFANYVNWSDYGVKDYFLLSGETKKFIREIENRYSVPVVYIGTSEEDMIDRRW